MPFEWKLIVSVLEPVLNLIHSIVEWLRMKRGKPAVPKETIRVVPNRNNLGWTLGQSGKNPCMHVRAEFSLANIADKPIEIVRAHLEPPAGLLGAWRWRRVRDLKDGLVALMESYDGSQRLRAVFPTPRDTAYASVLFSIQPPICSGGENLKATIVLTDQYGNEHKVKNLVIPSRG